MKTLAKIRRIGGSLIVTIPKQVVEVEDLEPKMIVEVEIEKVKKSFFGMAKGVGSFTKGDEMKGQLDDE